MNIRIAVLLFVAPWPAGAPAQVFQPARPVEIVVHNAPGGGSDLLARFISALVEKERLLPVRTLVHNRPGGGSALAMAYMAEKRGETHSIALFTSAWMMTPILSPEVTAGFNDMTPIARMVKTDAWRRYLEENQFEDGFQRGDALVKSSAEFVARMREMLQDAGLKVYR